MNKYIKQCLYVILTHMHMSWVQELFICLLHIIIWNVELGAKYVANVKQWMDLFLKKNNKKIMLHFEICCLALFPSLAEQ